MANEIKHILELFRESYDGSPWFGRSVKKILAEIDGEMAVQKPNGEHSILELVYHMVTWREFTISRLESQKKKNIKYFDENDWRELDHRDGMLWKKGQTLLDQTQTQLNVLIQNFPEQKLTDKVDERAYDFRFLLHGLIQHDIYHLGQIAYVKKLKGLKV